MTRSERYFKKGFGTRKPYKHYSRKQERMAIQAVASKSTLESCYDDDDLLMSVKSKPGHIREEYECVVPTKFLHQKMNKIDDEDNGNRCHYKSVKGGIIVS